MSAVAISDACSTVLNAIAERVPWLIVEIRVIHVFTHDSIGSAAAG